MITGLLRFSTSPEVNFGCPRILNPPSQPEPASWAFDKCSSIGPHTQKAASNLLSGNSLVLSLKSVFFVKSSGTIEQMLGLGASLGSRAATSALDRFSATHSPQDGCCSVPQAEGLSVDSRRFRVGHDKFQSVPRSICTPFKCPHVQDSRARRGKGQLFSCLLNTGPHIFILH